MKQLFSIPHLVKSGMCPVNGIRDLVQWHTGRNWSNEFLWGLGQGNGFAYLRFNAANPPRQVYTGNATPRQHAYLAGLLGAGLTEVENRAFKFSWEKARAALDQGQPPILGPLDMFHLPYYPELYHQRHIPIHFVLLVGYDADNACVQDTGMAEAQTIALRELQQAWDVNAPGMGRRNRLVVVDVPPVLPPDEALIRRAVADECRTMLRPPVSMLGIPAMRKLAAEIVGWPVELGEERAGLCLRQMREYLNSPPDVEGNHLTAGRDLYTAFLREAGELAGLDFSAAIGRLEESMAAVPELAGAVERRDLAKAAACLEQIAAVEADAYHALAKIVGALS